MKFDRTLTIIGSVIIVLLGVNGWYFRNIERSLSEIAVQLATITIDAKHFNQSVKENMKRLDDHDRRIRALEIKMGK